MPTQIGAQLYTLRDYCKTPADIAKTLARVKIGYDAAQVSGFGPIDSKELAKMLKNEGLVCAATHVPIDRMEKETAQVIEDHRLWDCKYTAVGGFSKGISAWDWHSFAKRFNDVAKKYAGTGIQIGYPTITITSWRRSKASRRLDLFLGKDGSIVWFEIDTYWIQPAAVIRPVDSQGEGADSCVHFKDMGVQTDRTQFIAEVGEEISTGPRSLRHARMRGCCGTWSSRTSAIAIRSTAWN